MFTAGIQLLICNKRANHKDRYGYLPAENYAELQKAETLQKVSPINLDIEPRRKG